MRCAPTRAAALHAGLVLGLAAGCSPTEPAADAAVAEDAVQPADGSHDAALTPDAGPPIPDVPDATRCELTVPTVASATLTTEGRRLRDPLGREVWLRGVNAGGRSKWAPFVPFDLAMDGDFDARATQLFDILEGWGLDVVRVPFSWEALEPTRGSYDDVYLERYARLVALAWERGMRVLVDFHQDVYASPFCGDGFPLWTLGEPPYGPPRRDCGNLQWGTAYGIPASGVPAAFQRFWTNEDGLFDAFVAMWEHLVTRLAREPGVVGYELLNEPGWGDAGRTDVEARLIPEMVETLTPRLRAIDPDALIFQGGTGLNAVEAATSMREPAVSGFVYAPHLYDASTIAGGRYSRGSPIRRRAQRLFDVGAGWQVPVLFGEFNAAWDGPDASLFLRDLYDAYDATGASATIWEASLSGEEWNHERLNLLLADGTERPQVDEVVRGYPRAIDGEVSRFVWLAQPAHALILEAQGGEAMGVSEIFVPTRHVGAAPRIGLDAGCVDWDPASGRLLVESATGAFTLVVEAR